MSGFFKILFFLFSIILILGGFRSVIRKEAKLGIGEDDGVTFHFEGFNAVLVGILEIGFGLWFCIHFFI